MQNHFRYMLSCLTLAILLPTAAQAQMTQQPWSFAQQNRASIAALMQQTEHPAATVIPPAPGDTLICGGGTGLSSATANSTCIILSQATGQIQLGQDSTGSQSASDIGVGTPAAPSASDAVLATLDGTAQSTTP